jgi:hypothetical protein
VGMVVMRVVSGDGGGRGGREAVLQTLEEKERACEYVRTWLILHMKLMCRVCRV